jgi:ABC-type uncharacterized transport system permease subunit
VGPFTATWLATSVTLMTPLLLAAIGELVSERVGVLNVGLEGMILTGAFTAFLCAWYTGSTTAGVFAGIGGGLALALIMAGLTIGAKADQIVVGIALVIVAFGITSYAYEEIFRANLDVTLRTPDALSVPLLSRIPTFGPALFEQTAIGYFAFAAVPLVWFLLTRTTWGMSIRAAGEQPAALEAAGRSVAKTRLAGTLVAGAMAGLAGAFLSVGQVGVFVEGMSSGRGFLVLGAVIFGRWRVAGILLACAIFGAADALQLQLQIQPTVPRQVWAALAICVVGYLAIVVVNRRAVPSWRMLAVASVLLAIAMVLVTTAPRFALPTQFWLAMPYVLPLLALIGVAARASAPKALAFAYRPGSKT